MANQNIVFDSLVGLVPTRMEKAQKPQTGDECWSVVNVLRGATTPLMVLWVDDCEGPSAVNVIFLRRSAVTSPMAQR